MNSRYGFLKAAFFHPEKTLFHQEKSGPIIETVDKFYIVKETKLCRKLRKI